MNSIQGLTHISFCQTCGLGLMCALVLLFSHLCALLPDVKFTCYCLILVLFFYWGPCVGLSYWKVYLFSLFLYVFVLSCPSLQFFLHLLLIYCLTWDNILQLQFDTHKFSFVNIIIKRVIKNDGINGRLRFGAREPTPWRVC